MGEVDRVNAEAIARTEARERLAGIYAEGHYQWACGRKAAREDFLAGWEAFDSKRDAHALAWDHACQRYSEPDDLATGARDFRAGWDERAAWERRYQRSA